MRQHRTSDRGYGEPVTNIMAQWMFEKIYMIRQVISYGDIEKYD